jgi:hypothetical protein
LYFVAAETGKGPGSLRSHGLNGADIFLYAPSENGSSAGGIEDRVIPAVLFHCSVAAA